MRVVIQRVQSAKVEVNEKIVGAIQCGFLVLVGIEEADNVEDIDYLVQKITQLRVFNDANGKMNLSLLDVNGALLIVSQFTLHASTKKGNRPSFIKAAKPEVAVPLYEHFIVACEKAIKKPVQRGIFGTEMQIHLVNNGPVTIVMDSKNKQ
jgi:D-aminoacyl-tRNA deacylase